MCVCMCVSCGQLSSWLPTAHCNRITHSTAQALLKLSRNTKSFLFQTSWALSTLRVYMNEKIKEISTKKKKNVSPSWQ